MIVIIRVMPCFDIYLWSLKTRGGDLSLWLKSEAPLWHFGLKYIKMRYLGKNYPNTGDGLVTWLGEVRNYWQTQLKKGRCHSGSHFKGLNSIVVKKNSGNIMRIAGHITLEIGNQETESNEGYYSARSYLFISSKVTWCLFTSDESSPFI